MKKEIYRAAAKGNVEFLKEALAKDVESATAAYSNIDLLGLTSQGSNIIHVAAQHGHHDFIMDALQSFQAAADRRKLICGTNSDGDTPLHFAAKQRTQVIAEQLIASYKQLISPQDEELDATGAPWRVQNKDGNTPLHVALMNGGTSFQVAANLLEIGPEVAALTNNRKEAPLHLAVAYDHQGTELSAIKMINTLNSHGAALKTSRTSLLVNEYEANSLSLVRFLLEKNSEVCYLCDANGMTPLLRAAISSNLPIVDAIINDCPESIEVCDPKGKNMLHYIRIPTFLEARKFLEKPEISVLHIEKQDHDGNTPMHVAVMNRDFGMVKAMVQCNANFAIKNKDGVCAQTLFDQFVSNDKLGASAETQIESKWNKSRELINVEMGSEKESIMDELMSNELYIAIGRGEWETLREKLKYLSYEKQFLSRLPDGSNIIHLAIHQYFKDIEIPEFFISYHSHFIDHEPCSSEEFIMDALNKFPFLSCQTNNLGQTPVHIAIARERLMKPEGILFTYIKKHFRHLKEQGDIPQPLPLPPWKAKDLQGNTILHLAVKWGNIEFVKYLMQLDANLAGEINHSKETPLHMLCRENFSEASTTTFQEIVDVLIEKDVTAVYSRDSEGFTPLLRAVQDPDYLDIVLRILQKCPQSIRHYDPHGRNIFHYLDIPHQKEVGEIRKRFFQTVQHREMEIVVTQEDDEGNTPYDLAIQLRRFPTARFINECSENPKVWYIISPKTMELLRTAQIPRWYQDLCESDNPTTAEFVSVGRSAYGVRKEDIKEYMNPMGVVAGLLATLTFTAAFTVPGDYNDHGIPNLGTKAAFQVFMVADLAGMCSSMMVLFCLLWFLTCEDIEDEVKLVDMTINLLQMSFYATLVAFMTGVYVTSFSDTPWLAIFTCVLCSLLILLMRRRHVKIISITLRVLPFLMYRVIPYYFKRYSKKHSLCQPRSRAAGHNGDQQQPTS